MLANPGAGRVVPGPQGYPLIGVLPSLLSDPLRTIEQAMNRYGDLIRLPIGPQKIYLLRNPEHIREVLYDQQQRFEKGAIFRVLGSVAGSGLVTSEGELWQRQRRLIQPAFHRQRLATLATRMTDATQTVVDRWQALAESNTPFDLAQEMMLLTQSIIVATMFGTTLGDDAAPIGDAVSTVLRGLGQRMWTFALPKWVPLPGRRSFQEAMTILDTTVYRMINSRRTTGDSHDDLLDMLLAARDGQTNQGMSDQQVRDEVMTIFIAGHETTGNALGWTWFLLAKHPDIMQRVYAEVDSVLGTRVPTMTDLPQLRYTRMVIQEAMRLYSTSWMIPRASVSDTTIGEYAIPAKSVMILSPYFMHRHPTIWRDAEQFNPERFNPDHEEEAVRKAYLPFGGGPRQCIGSQFAMMEAQFIVAMIAQRYQLQLVPGQRIEPKAHATLHPPAGIHVTTRLREKAHDVGA